VGAGGSCSPAERIAQRLAKPGPPAPVINTSRPSPVTEKYPLPEAPAAASVADSSGSAPGGRGQWKPKLRSFQRTPSLGRRIEIGCSGSEVRGITEEDETVAAEASSGPPTAFSVFSAGGQAKTLPERRGVRRIYTATSNTVPLHDPDECPGVRSFDSAARRDGAPRWCDCPARTRVRLRRQTSALHDSGEDRSSRIPRRISTTPGICVAQIE